MQRVRLWIWDLGFGIWDLGFWILDFELKAVLAVMLPQNHSKSSSVRVIHNLESKIKNPQVFPAAP